MNKNARNPVKAAEPAERIKNFGEVSLGYDRETMMSEAERCIGCKHAPCVNGCPVRVDIPRFIAALKQDNPVEANRIIKENNSLPAVCGRVCPQEVQCEKYCVRARSGGPVAIGALERYAADFALKAGEKVSPPRDKIPLKVAVVGSGPAGLAAAGELAKNGASVTVFEAFHRPGGVLVYGIPEFRLPKSIVKEEVSALVDMGVEFRLNTVIGKTFTLEELLERYDYVFLGSGAGLPVFLGIKGENLPGVYTANEFLTRIVLMRGYLPTSDTPIKRGRKVAVVGAGNVAMDAARTALRLGAERVTLIYRRGREEMPAREEEIERAEEEGVEFFLLASPIEIFGTDKVSGIRCVKTELKESAEDGRRSFAAVAGSEFDIECDLVIIAIGTNPNPLIKKSAPELKTNPKGIITIDESGKTSLDRVYAGGDAVTGAATVILAMGAGKQAAKSILERYYSERK